MKPSFQRVLVCLDLSDHDEILIRVCSRLVKEMGTEHIDFFHVVEHLELPSRLLEEYPDIAVPVDESVSKFIEESIAKSAPITVPYEIHVVEGNPTDRVLKWSNIKDVDLIVMGKKATDHGSGILPEKIVKVSNCSILLVPVAKRKTLEKILVPTDFSRNAKHALEYALRIGEIYNAEVVCNHVYRVPTGYHTSGKSYEEFAAIMEGHARKDFERWLKEYDLPKVDCIYQLDKDHNHAKVSHQVALDSDFTMIVMGSLGRTGLASVLVGSNAMRMIKYEHKMPLLVVKEKGENMGLLQALLRV